jgi:hypothetical protein
VTDPISYTSTSPRYALPFLFTGQSHKESFVNEAFALADMLLHPAIEGTIDTPPASPAAGECWRVRDAPTGEWTGRTGCLAAFQADTWLFARPRNGMSLLDLSTGQIVRYFDGWKAPVSIAALAGGAVIDSEARDAVAQIVAALKTAGILPAG